MRFTRLEHEIHQQGLPANFMATVNDYYAPIANDLARRAAQQHNALIVGVQGCQGSGKSTLAAFLKILLETRHNCPTAVLSIDDFYLTKQQRLTLAADVHPLLATRGVPGTHDIDLAHAIIRQLAHLQEGEHLAIPRFDKSIDDRAKPETWDHVHNKQAVIILEGWCVGLSAQKTSHLDTPRNSLEEIEDSNAIWRHHVNNALNTSYQDVFSTLQTLIVLSAPSFDCVFRWRSLQEDKLRQKITKQGLSSAEHKALSIMNTEQLLRFISHYQRLTEHALTSLPHRADWLLSLDDSHAIIACRSPKLR